MKQTVYFERTNGEIITIGTNECTQEESYRAASTTIKDFCAKHNYKIPYTRMWDASLNGVDMTCLDVGSHTEFFWVEPPLKLIT